MITILLIPGFAYASFNVTNKNIQLRIHLHWLTRYSYYSVDIFDSEMNPVAMGRALHPGMDLLDGLNVNMGSLILEGEQPTMGNLGMDNRLVWKM